MRPWQLREQRSCRDGEETVQREAVDGFVWHPGLRISHEFRDPLQWEEIGFSASGPHPRNGCAVAACLDGVDTVRRKEAAELEAFVRLQSAGGEVARVHLRPDGEPRRRRADAREDFAKQAGAAGGRAAPAIRTVTSIFPSTTSAPGSRPEAKSELPPGPAPWGWRLASSTR